MTAPAHRLRSEEGAPDCQFCGASLSVTWVDLGMQPLANAYAPDADTALALPRYPLHARACPKCWLVQVDRVVPPEDIFSDYAYFSSYSESWLEHCRLYSEAVIRRFKLGPQHLVVEIASNDGYLLKHFAAAGIPVQGIDPAANVAEAAKQAGIPTEVDFFGADLARRMVACGKAADHLSAKNVLAHVPEIGDFVEGVSILLKPGAVFTVEFPHLLRTMRQLQFDQIYHEHFTYLSLVAIERVLSSHGLRIFDVEEIATHGGSLRLFVCHDAAQHETAASVDRVRNAEREAGLESGEGYAGFAERVAAARTGFLEFLARAQAENKSVAAYGAAAKGNTFLNYCESGPESLRFVADRSAAKAGKFMPGSGIPIVTPDRIETERPDYLVILPWNLKDEIASQMQAVRGWGGRFVTAIPHIHVF